MLTLNYAPLKSHITMVMHVPIAVINFLTTQFSNVHRWYAMIQNILSLISRLKNANNAQQGRDIELNPKDVSLLSMLPIPTLFTITFKLIIIRKLVYKIKSLSYKLIIL